MLNLEARTALHKLREEASDKNLKQAQKSAFEERNYNSAATRAALELEFKQFFGFDPRGWQVDVAEAIILGLDTVLIAGTGAGKTMPFIMPVLIDPQKCVVILSPLNILEEDQAARFNKIGISAVAVNGETFTKDLQQEIMDSKYQVILTSPKTCLKNASFRMFLTSSSFGERCATLVVDEAHCISQWGGDFRKEYARISELKVFLPPGVPLLLASASMNPEVLEEVRRSVELNLDECFHINLGNDRPNITHIVQKVEGSKDNLQPVEFVTQNFDRNAPVKKTIVFANEKATVQLICRHLRGLVPTEHKSKIAFVHAVVTPRNRRRTIKRFRAGEVLILVATEVAGMGLDIPDIELVVQFMVPANLSIWIQRAGRAARDPTIQARAILLVEKSAWKSIKSEKDKEKDRPEDGEDESEPDEDEVGPSGGELKYRKKVEPGMRVWVDAKANECRRDLADNYYNNPPKRLSPTGACCDNCEPSPNSPDVHSLTQLPHALSDHDHLTPSQPHTPSVTSASDETTPEEAPSANTKRKMKPPTNKTRKQKPQTRREKHLSTAKDALTRWRVDKKLTEYLNTSFTEHGVLPDVTLGTLASNARFESLDDIRAGLQPPWVFLKQYGEEVLAILRAIDEENRTQRAEAIIQKREAKKRLTRARQEAKKEEMKIKREAKKQATREKREEAAKAKKTGQKSRRSREIQRAELSKTTNALVFSTTDLTDQPPQPSSSNSLLSAEHILTLQPLPQLYYPYPYPYSYPHHSMPPSGMVSQSGVRFANIPQIPHEYMPRPLYTYPNVLNDTPLVSASHQCPLDDSLPHHFTFNHHIKHN